EVIERSNGVRWQGAHRSQFNDNIGLFQGRAGVNFVFSDNDFNALLLGLGGLTFAAKEIVCADTKQQYYRNWYLKFVRLGRNDTGMYAHSTTIQLRQGAA